MTLAHRNPGVEKRIRELALSGWLSAPRLIAELARAVNGALEHAESQPPEDDLTPARRAHRALIDGRRLSPAELRGDEPSPAELAFLSLLDDRRGYSAWAHATRVRWLDRQLYPFRCECETSMNKGWPHAGVSMAARRFVTPWQRAR